MPIEKEWITDAGLLAVVLIQPLGHRCGYVGVPSNLPAYGKHYDELNDIDVHGGLTFSDHQLRAFDTDENLYWFGFDCAHYIDQNNPKSLDYCVIECEKLAEQLLVWRPTALITVEM